MLSTVEEILGNAKQYIVYYIHVYITGCLITLAICLCMLNELVNGTYDPV